MKRKEKNQEQIFEELFARFPVLNPCKCDIYSSFEMMVKTYENGNKILICGNGGSAADSEHIVGELMKSFLFNRKIDKGVSEALAGYYGESGLKLSKTLEGALPAISLTGMSSISTAFANDTDPAAVFAQLVYGYGVEGDLVLGISTSGNSQNIINALMVAKAKKLNTIGLTGETGGKMKDYCDIAIRVPAAETYMIQELHLPVYHALCAMLEAYFFDEA